MSRPFFSGPMFERNPAHSPPPVDKPAPPPHQTFHQNAPDPVYMEIEYLVHEIRQSGATELLMKKMTEALKAYEAIVRMEKRLVHVRLEANLARIDAMHQAEIPLTEAAELDGVSTIQEEPDEDVEYETQELIEEQLDIINGLPKLADRKLIILFSARVVTAYRKLCKLSKLDESLMKETSIANEVFVKVIDILEPEWIQYIKQKRVDNSQVHLSVIADFLQEEALKEANRLPLYH